MFEVIRSFFMDGATFKRTVSDVIGFGGSAVALAGQPEFASTLAQAGLALNPKIAAIAALSGLVGTLWSARQRQTAPAP